MKNCRIVVDTNIVVDAYREYNDLNLRSRCGEVLKSFLKSSNLMLTFDLPSTFEGESFIIGEYRKHLGGLRDFEIYYAQLFRNDKVKYVVPASIADISGRLDEIGFHEEEDRKFLATALAANKIIVTEDSDYGIPDDPEYLERYEFFTQEQGMEINNSERFIDRYCL